MKILIACEFSGIIRNAFTEKGHDAMSCDLLPTEQPGSHFQGDMRDIINDDWDMIIAHPPCTYLCNSGVRWLHETPGRWEQLKDAKEFFNLFLKAKAKRIAIENPIPHKYAELPRYNQIIHPWMFGHPESKSTCLWLKGLPKLEPTTIAQFKRYRCKCGNVFEEELGKYGCCDYPARPLWDNQTKNGQNKLSPSKDRAKDRSRTYTGIAEAMSIQWNF